jgi:hypothetical protein
LIERLLLTNVWFAIALGVIFYIATYLLGLYEIYLYNTGAKDFIVIPNRYDLTPDRQAAITQRRWFNWKLAAILVVMSIGIGLAWQISIGQYARSDVFSVLIGGLLLLEIADAAQRIRNIILFYNAPKAGNAKGKIEYSRRLVYSQAFFEMYIFATIYLFVFFTTGSWLFFGGGITCIVAGRRQRDWTVIRT